MKLTKLTLQRLIKEELQKVFEQPFPGGPGASASPPQPPGYESEEHERMDLSMPAWCWKVFLQRRADGRKFSKKISFDERPDTGLRAKEVAAEKHPGFEVTGVERLKDEVCVGLGKVQRDD